MELRRTEESPKPLSLTGPRGSQRKDINDIGYPQKEIIKKASNRVVFRRYGNMIRFMPLRASLIPSVIQGGGPAIEKESFLDGH